MLLNNLLKKYLCGFKMVCREFFPQNVYSENEFTIAFYVRPDKSNIKPFTEA